MGWGGQGRCRVQGLGRGWAGAGGWCKLAAWLAGLGWCRWLVQVAGADGWCRWLVPMAGAGGKNMVIGFDLGSLPHLGPPRWGIALMGEDPMRDRPWSAPSVTHPTELRPT